VNLPTLKSGWQLLGGVFLIAVFKNKLRCSYFHDSLRVPARLVRDVSIFGIHHHEKVTPSASCVSAANAVCRYIAIFNRKFISLILVGKPEGKRPLGRPRRRWEDNIKIDLREIGWGSMDWIDLAQDRDQWTTLENTIMNLRVP
jgi:hypothetical protein